MAYRSADKRDRWKAIVGVVAVHVALGAAILTGLNVNIVGEAVERLETFDVTLEQPPPEEPPPPPQRAREEQGAPAAPEPSPVVAPEPEVVVPTQNPIAAAPEAGTGASSSIGRGGVGSGTGAGGAGTGAGSGAGGGAGFTPARITRKIPNSEYRRISAGRVPAGSATMRFIVTPQGRMQNCRVVRSSGDPHVDSVLCQVAERRMRFAPARDPSGRPVAQDMTYTPTWRPR